MKLYLELFRIQQWIKNLLVFAALIFAQKITDIDSVIICIHTFGIFCCAASSVYIMNDIFDRNRDSFHPEKKHRPIASGQIQLRTAIILCVLLCALWSYWAIALSFSLFCICVIYYSINILYSWKLKHIVIIDIMCISSGFVLRILAGAIALNVHASSWLIICTSSIALFIAVCKRRHEIDLLEHQSSSHRKVLEQYTRPFIDQMISVATTAAVMSYTLYTLSPITVNKFHTRNLIFSVPFVVFGIFRYLYLVYYKKAGGNPSQIIIEDIPLIADVILWVICIILILY